MTTTNEELVKEALDLAISFRDYEPGQQDEVMERGWDETADLLDHLADALEAATAAPDAALSPAPLTINREVLARLLARTDSQSGTDEFEWEIYLPTADAVISHLSAQTVEGEVEWGVRNGDLLRGIDAAQVGYWRVQYPEDTVLRRTVGPWIEV